VNDEKPINLNGEMEPKDEFLIPINLGELSNKNQIKLLINRTQGFP